MMTHMTMMVYETQRPVAVSLASDSSSRYTTPFSTFLIVFLVTINLGKTKEPRMYGLY